MSAAETSDGNENDFKNISRLPTFQASSHSCPIHCASTSAPKFGCFDESKSILGCSLLYHPPGVWAQLPITSHKTDARQVFIGISPPLMAAYNLTGVPHSTDSLGRQLAPYPYQPLDFDTHEIRLLILGCIPIERSVSPVPYCRFRTRITDRSGPVLCSLVLLGRSNHQQIHIPRREHRQGYSKIFSLRSKLHGNISARSIR